MRDIMRDAAIITVAKKAMEEDSWMSVDVFVATYAKKEDDRLELLSTLSLFGLAYQKYEQDRWSLEGQYNWYWCNEN